MVMLWDMRSPFYSEWALMQWTYPPSLRATKCTVCQYAGRQWHLYSMLWESWALYSYFEFQKWMWTYVVSFHAECIRLLAGRGKNISHEVWSLSKVLQPHRVYNKHKELLQSCYWKLKENPHIWCWPCPLDCYFLGHSHNTCEVTNSTARRIQEPNLCHDNCKNFAKMRQVHQGALGLCQ